MKIQKISLCRGVLVGSAALAFCCWQAGAQTAAARSGAQQNGRVAARVLDTVDDTNRTMLRGNVPIRIVASLHDTSVVIIEKHYSAYITDDDALARATLPDFGIAMAA